MKIIKRNKIDTAPAYKIISVNAKNFIFKRKRIQAFNKKTMTSEKAECAGFRDDITQPQKNKVKNVKNFIKNNVKNIKCNEF